MPNLGLFNYVKGIFGTGDLVAQDASISGAGSIPCGPYTSDYDGLIEFRVQTTPDPDEQWIYSEAISPTGNVSYTSGMTGGVVHLPEICESYDLAGCVVQDVGGDWMRWYPATATDGDDAWFGFHFRSGAPGLAKLNVFIQPGFHTTGPGTNPTSYWESLGVTDGGTIVYTLP